MPSSKFFFHKNKHSKFWMFAGFKLTQTPENIRLKKNKFTQKEIRQFFFYLWPASIFFASNWEKKKSQLPMPPRVAANKETIGCLMDCNLINIKFLWVCWEISNAFFDNKMKVYKKHQKHLIHLFIWYSLWVLINSNIGEEIKENPADSIETNSSALERQTIRGYYLNLVIMFIHCLCF